MKNYEKKTFLQIFLGYFLSVTVLILLLGALYFEQQKFYVMQKTAMSMHRYLIKLKQSNFTYTQEGYSYDIVQDAKAKKQLPKKEGKFYTKTFVNKLVIKIDANIVDSELLNIKIFTIILQRSV